MKNKTPPLYLSPSPPAPVPPLYETPRPPSFVSILTFGGGGMYSDSAKKLTHPTLVMQLTRVMEDKLVGWLEQTYLLRSEGMFRRVRHELLMLGVSSETSRKIRCTPVRSAG